MVPKGWDVKTLNEVSKITRLAGAEYSDVWETNPNGEIIALRGYNIGNNHINLRDVERITQEMSLKLSRSKLFKDDIVFPCVGSIGKAYLVKEDNRFHINQNIAKLTPDETVDPLYLTYCLLSKESENQIMKFNTSSSQPNVLVGNLRKFEFQFPPSVLEQQKIAKILSTWDKAISATERLIDNSTQQKKALMQQLLTGKKRLLDDEGKRFEGEWEDVTLGNCADLTAGGTPSTKKSEYWGGEIPWMNSGEVNLKQVFSVEGRITQAGLDNSSTKIIPTNSILIALAGQGKTRGTVAINRINLCTNQSIAAIMPHQDILDHDFLYFNLDSRYQELRSMSTGDGGRGGLNLSILKSIKILLPSLKEQQKIATVLTNADKEIELLEQQLADLQQEKKALMQVLLTGKKRVVVDGED